MYRIIISLCIYLSLVSCSISQDIQQDISVPTGSTVPTILVLGDSVTAGLGIDIADAYPAQLQEKLQKNGYMYTVINAGISLDTTDSLLARLPWNLQDIPDIAIVCIGANDAFQGKNPADIEKNIHEIVRTLQSKNIPILLVGMYAPRNLWAEYIASYESIFPKTRDTYSLAYVPFLLEWVALVPTLNQPDGIHPTREWYTIVADTVYTWLVDSGLVRRNST